MIVDYIESYGDGVMRLRLLPPPDQPINRLQRIEELSVPDM